MCANEIDLLTNLSTRGNSSVSLHEVRMETQISLKLKDDVKEEEVEAIIARLAKTPGVTCIQRLFPEPLSRELGLVYFVEVAPSQADAALRFFEGDPDLQYAHFPQSRTPQPI